MELTAVLTVLGVFIANAAMIIPLFLWTRAAARADARHTDAKLESTRELVRAFQYLDFVQFLNSSSERCFLQLNKFLGRVKNTLPAKFITLQFASLANIRPKIVQSRDTEMRDFHERLLIIKKQKAQ